MEIPIRKGSVSAQRWMAKLLGVLLTMLLVGSEAYAQPPAKPLVQVSGLTRAMGMKVPIPFTAIRIKNTYRGTIAGLDGYYSLPAGEGDTLEYVAVGFKTLQWIIPSNVEDHKVTHEAQLETDTIEVRPEAEFPYATREEFKKAVLALKFDDAATDNAKRNLDPARLAELYETLARDGEENQIYTLQSIAQSYYYSGGQKNYMMMGNGMGMAIPTSLLDPFAWNQFIKELKKGTYKKKKKVNTDY